MDVSIEKDEFDRPGNRFNPMEVLNKQPGYRYRMLNKNPHNLARKAMLGYEVVTGDTPEKLKFSEHTPLKQGASLDTTRQYHDLVLGRIKEEDFQRNVYQPWQLQQRRQSGAVEREYMRKAVSPSGRSVGFEGEGGGGYTGSMTEAQFNAQQSKVTKK